MTNIPLATKHCIPREGGVPPATDQEITRMLSHVPMWQVREDKQHTVIMKTLYRKMKFDDFRSAMVFLRKVEDLAESEGHHPDFCVHYNVVEFTLFTHAIRGLHENDFILAAKINALNND